MFEYFKIVLKSLRQEQMIYFNTNYHEFSINSLLYKIIWLIQCDLYVEKMLFELTQKSANINLSTCHL